MRVLWQIGVAWSVLLSQPALESARRLAESGRVREAIQLLEARSSPSAPELAFLAQLHAATGALPQAVSSLDRALELAPEQHGLRTTRGAMLFELRRFQEAREELQRVLRDRPDEGLAHYYLAAVERSTGELADAKRSAERAVALLPRQPAPLVGTEHAPHVAARHLLAEIRFELGEDSEPLLREVLGLEPLHAPARYLLGRVLAARGSVEEAHRELRRFEQIKTADRHVAEAQDLALVPERREEVLRELRLAIEGCPDHVRALVLLGRELARAGRKEESKAAFERATALRPDLEGEIRRFAESLP